jgi:hypothetical protein
MARSPSLLNINQQFIYFVKDLDRFRCKLGEHDGLIAGEFI